MAAQDRSSSAQVHLMQMDFLEKILELNRSLQETNVEVAEGEEHLIKGICIDRNGIL